MVENSAILNHMNKHDQLLVINPRLLIRDILLTSSSMNQDITSKRIISLESLKQDERLVRTIVDDNKLISEYMKELFNMEEIGKNYIEPFIKVVENMKKINQFVTELKNIDTVVDEE